MMIVILRYYDFTLALILDVEVDRCFNYLLYFKFLILYCFDSMDEITMTKISPITRI